MSEGMGACGVIGITPTVALKAEHGTIKAKVMGSISGECVN